MRTALIFTLMLALTGCNSEADIIDASTSETYGKTIASVREGLPVERREEFNNALLQVVGSSIPTDENNPFAKLTAMAALAQNPKALVDAVRPIVHGKSGLEIIGIGQNLKREQRDRQLRAIDGEIAAINSDISELEDVKENQLKKITTTNARYYWQKSGYRKQAVIEFQITNGSKTAIAKISLEGILETPGRSVPWVRDTFSYAIKGGLEPGESQKLKLAPNMFGPWSKSDLADRKDLVLTVALQSYQDASGNKISATDIGTKRSRLDDLKKQRQKLIAEQL